MYVLNPPSSAVGALISPQRRLKFHLAASQVKVNSLISWRRSQVERSGSGGDTRPAQHGEIRRLPGGAAA